MRIGKEPAAFCGRLLFSEEMSYNVGSEQMNKVKGADWDAGN